MQLELIKVLRAQINLFDYICLDLTAINKTDRILLMRGKYLRDTAVHLDRLVVKINPDVN